jgi:hypothetical protein
MAVLKGAVGSSNPKFRQIRDCEAESMAEIGQRLPCENKSVWVVFNQDTEKKVFCCSKHLTQILNKEHTYLVYSVVREMGEI